MQRRVFFGIEFQIGGDTHFGYIDVEGQHDTVGVIVYGWAYETTPNTPIVATQVPEAGKAACAMMGLLLCVLRRRRAFGAG